VKKRAHNPFFFFKPVTCPTVFEVGDGDVLAKMSSALTVGEAAMERNIADKERLLLQLQQQAAALASEINTDHVRLSTARSGAGRRPRTSVQGAHSFTPHSFGLRHQIGDEFDRERENEHKHKKTG
jgi:hypothetical protein